MHWDEVSRRAAADVGARPFIDAHPDQVVDVPCDDVADPADIDTVEDLREISARDRPLMTRSGEAPAREQ
jgi:nicotine blue oxidoreductase